ncbi:MAG: insulinase family protein, partial [Flavisolibacter sp.]|nr:insulinase family protein [Flavisolibacter sp.]
YPADKAGIENLALTALTECGTANDDKNSFKNKLDKVSARINGSTNMDYATINMNCIKSDFETVWPLYVDAITKPRFDPKEFERIRQDAINILRANESDPDQSLERMAKMTAFAGKPYAIDPNGTVDTVSKLTSEETRRYWQSILSRSRMIVVVVGDLDKTTIANKVKALTALIPQGKPVVFKKESYQPGVNTFKPQQRDNATNYILGISSAPLPGTPDYNAYVLAMRLFSMRHFIEIRSKNGLSYAPGAWLSPGLTPFTNVYVTTTEPDKYIITARKLIDSIRQKGFTPEELKNIKTQYITGVYYNQETNESQASALVANEVWFNNWRRAYTIKDEMKKVTLNDLNNAFSKYLNNITWVYQGDPKKVNQSLFTQKQVPQITKETKTF